MVKRRSQRNRITSADAVVSERRGEVREAGSSRTQQRVSDSRARDAYSPHLSIMNITFLFFVCFRLSFPFSCCARNEANCVIHVPVLATHTTQS